MTFDPTRFEKARARNARLKGISVPATVDMAFEKYVVSRQLYIYEQCFRAGADAAGFTLDASASVEGAVFSMYSRLHNVELLADRLKSDFVKGSAYHRRAFVNSINSAIGVNLSSTLPDDKAAAEVEARVADSVNLITGFDLEMLATVAETITSGVFSGADEFSLKKLLKDKAKVPGWRAKLIARDQMGKLFGNLAEIRNTDIGITHYFWRTVGDLAVRDSHEAVNNLRFEWAKGPDWGHPGQDIQCRCVADPDFTTVNVTKLIV